MFCAIITDIADTMKSNRKEFPECVNEPGFGGVN
jgi:hypothetical protein